MRTTIDIHDELLARAKRVAADQHKKLSDLVNDALLQALDHATKATAPHDLYQVVPLAGDGPQPGVDFQDNGSIQDAMDEELRDPATGQLDFDKLR